jgi:RNA recognition motif-containing protein
MPISRHPAVERISVLGFFDSVFPNPCTLFSDSEHMNIYVGNLPFSITDADLRETFSRFGDVSQVNLITDKFTGESKGFGFVEMANNSQADAAIKGLNGKDLKGRNITVNQAKPKTDRPTRDRRY